MTFLVMAPGVEIITLTRDMALSREYEINYLKEHGFEADFTKLKYSYNVGIWGTSYLRRRNLRFCSGPSGKCLLETGYQNGQ